MAEIVAGAMNLEDVRHGDLFDVVFDVEGIDLTGKTLFCQVRREMDAEVCLTFRESDGSLIKNVVSSNLTTVTLRKSSTFMKSVSPYAYKYDIIMFTTNDDEQTIIEGKINVIPRITEGGEPI